MFGIMFIMDQLVLPRSLTNVSCFSQLPLLPMANSSPLDLKRFRDQKRGRPLKMIAAAGPYTLSDNLLFEPFAELMNHVHKERPDVLLLVCNPSPLSFIALQRIPEKSYY